MVAREERNTKQSTPRENGKDNGGWGSNLLFLSEKWVHATLLLDWRCSAFGMRVARSGEDPQVIPQAEMPRSEENKEYLSSNNGLTGVSVMSWATSFLLFAFHAHPCPSDEHVRRIKNQVRPHSGSGEDVSLPFTSLSPHPINLWCTSTSRPVLKKVKANSHACDLVPLETRWAGLFIFSSLIQYSFRRNWGTSSYCLPNFDCNCAGETKVRDERSSRWVLFDPHFGLFSLFAKVI